MLATGKTFPSGTAQQFLKDEKADSCRDEAAGGRKLPGERRRGGHRESGDVATGGGSPKAEFFGHLPTHPLSDAYYSQAPIRFGSHVAKLAAFPSASEMTALANKTLDVGDDLDASRHAVVSFFRDHDVTF